ncbi:MAG: recombinase family protein [Eubacterium sp.]|nr:recombinase family protein [Eubacterium sp.]
MNFKDNIPSPEDFIRAAGYYKAADEINPESVQRKQVKEIKPAGQTADPRLQTAGLGLQGTGPGFQTAHPGFPGRRLRVACYCRVSTVFSDQDGSIENQRRHYEDVIRSNPYWELAGTYCERVSGTHVEGRPELQYLLRECERKRVDLILTKSISRFSRSTTDLLSLVRTLKGYGARIIFEEENIDTGSAEGEFMISLLASVAEAEVRSISENNKWAIRKRFENGTYIFPRAPYGYDVRDGRIEINECEAEIVRFIFSSYINGASPQAIARHLNEEGIPTKRAGEKWRERKPSGKWNYGTVGQMLRNVFYTGDCLLQKNYHGDDYRVRQNKGALPQYYIQDHHEAIIDRATYEEAQEMIKLRSEKHNGQAKTARKRYTLSGKCKCGLCGATLIREIRRGGRRKERHAGKRKDGKCGGEEGSQTTGRSVGTYWVCAKHRRNKEACSLRQVKEEDIWEAFARTLRGLKDDSNITRVWRELKDDSNSIDMLLEEELFSFLEYVKAYDGRQSELEKIFTESVEKVIISDRAPQIRFRMRYGLVLMEDLLI